MTNDKKIEDGFLIDYWNGQINKLLRSLRDKNNTFKTFKNIDRLKSELDILFNQFFIEKLEQESRKVISDLLSNIKDVIYRFSIASSSDGLLVLIDQNDADEIARELDLIKYEFSKITNFSLYMEQYKESKKVFDIVAQENEKLAKRMANIYVNDQLYTVFRTEEIKTSIYKTLKQITFFFILIIIFLISVAFMISYSGLEDYFLSIFSLDRHWCFSCVKNNSNENIITLLISKVTILIPLFWAAAFLSKSIRDDDKVRQTYKHKKVVTRAYLNYLEFMRTHYSDDIEEVRKSLIEVAIDSMKINPALLLEKGTAEKIPMEELLSKIIDKAGSNIEKGKD